MARFLNRQIPLAELKDELGDSKWEVHGGRARRVRRRGITNVACSFGKENVMVDLEGHAFHVEQCTAVRVHPHVIELNGLICRFPKKGGAVPYEAPGAIRLVNVQAIEALRAQRRASQWVAEFAKTAEQQELMTKRTRLNERYNGISVMADPSRLLSPREAAQVLTDGSGWHVEGGRLVKTFGYKNRTGGIAAAHSFTGRLFLTTGTGENALDSSCIFERINRWTIVVRQNVTEKQARPRKLGGHRELRDTTVVLSLVSSGYWREEYERRMAERRAAEAAAADAVAAAPTMAAVPSANG